MKNITLNTAFTYLSLTTGTGLSVDELKELRNVRKEIKSKIEEYNEVRKSIWESHGIKEDKDLIVDPESDTDGVRAAQVMEAQSKIFQLDNEEAQVEGLNFLSEDKVIECSPKNLNQHDIDKMVELLAKK